MTTAITSDHLRRSRRGVISLRISKDELGDELAIERHRRKAERIAARLRIDVEADHVFMDNDASGYRATRKRTEWDAAMAVLRRGDHGHLITTALDRLTRQDLRVCEDLIDFFRAHDVVVHTDEDNYDLETVNGRARFRKAAVDARAESERISQRTQDLHEDLRDRGSPNGGPRPYGWQRTGHKATYKGDEDTRALVPDADEAPIVAEVTRRVAAGETLTPIARDLNRRGVRTRTGNPWNATNLRRVVLNGTNAGLRMHKDQEVGPAAWAERAIVDVATWRRARRALTDENRPKRRAARRYLLSGGLLRCGKCDAPLHSKPLWNKGRPVPVYTCSPARDLHHPGCGGVTIRAEQTEAIVAEAVLRHIESKEFAKALRAQAGGDRDAERALVHLERELDEYALDVAAGKLNKRRFDVMAAGLERQMEAARARLGTDTTMAAVGRYAGRRNELRAEWERRADDLDWRQAIVRSVLDHVVIAPVGKGGNRFDSRRIDGWTWRA